MYQEFNTHLLSDNKEKGIDQRATSHVINIDMLETGQMLHATGNGQDDKVRGFLSLCSLRVFVILTNI